MKRNVIKTEFKAPPKRRTAQFVLHGDTPFRPKVVESKVVYSRKVKNQKEMNLHR